MKKINKIFNVIALWIFVSVLIGVSGTFLSDYLVSIDWFGDHSVTRFNSFYGKEVVDDYWGARHYWYNWGVFLLFSVSTIRGIVCVVFIIEKK